MANTLHWYNAFGRQFSIFFSSGKQGQRLWQPSKVLLEVDEVTGVLSLLGHG
jgi:hypothetical protein